MRITGFHSIVEQLLNIGYTRELVFEEQLRRSMIRKNSGHNICKCLVSTKNYVKEEYFHVFVVFSVVIRDTVMKA